MAAQASLERFVHRCAAGPVGTDEHGVPAAGPAERRGGTRHFGVAFGDGGVIGGGDRALLGAERVRRIAACGFHVFRVDAAGGGHRVFDAGDLAGIRQFGGVVRVQRRIEHQMRQRLGADVAGAAVADSVMGGEYRVFGGASTVLAFAEAQPDAAVMLGFDDEVFGRGVAVQQVVAWLPGLRLRARAGGEGEARQRGADIQWQQQAGRPEWIIVAGRHCQQLDQFKAPGQRRLLQRRAESRRHLCALRRAATVGIALRVERGVAVRRHRIKILARQRAPVIGQHDVAQRDADDLVAPGHADAQRERQRVGRVPGDAGDIRGSVDRRPGRVIEQLAGGIDRWFDPGQADRPAMAAVGVFLLERGGAALFAEHQHIARRERRMAGQGRLGRTARQAAALVAPGVEVQRVAIAVQGGLVRGLEHDRPGAQCFAFLA